MSVRVLTGDCRAMLATLPDASVQCCVTSPPYFGLRDYGTASWEGGDPTCAHTGIRREHNPNDKQATSAGSSRDPVARDCRRCGAVRTDSQIGLEASPDAFVAEMVAVFREVRRVLRDDGCVWLNLGDSYAGGKTGRTDQDSMPTPKGGHRENSGPATGIQRPVPPGYKPKDLLGIPWAVAFALRADGWWLRSDIIWAKPNPMPESVTDRCTSAHEHVFLLSKRASYYWDASAVREDCSDTSHGGPNITPGWKNEALGQGAGNLGKWTAEDKANGRNMRNVWTIATQPYSGAHFATMPADLVERCIKAGTKPGDTVLDPFAGAGTTGLVADRLGRNAVLIELNPAYAAMARDRISDDCPMFAEVAD